MIGRKLGTALETFQKPEPDCNICLSRTPALLLHSALVGTRDAHIFPVLGNRAASDLNPL